MSLEKTGRQKTDDQKDKVITQPYFGLQRVPMLCKSD